LAADPHVTCLPTSVSILQTKQQDIHWQAPSNTSNWCKTTSQNQTEVTEMIGELFMHIR